MTEVRVAIVDDHSLFRSGIASVLSEFSGYKILFEAGNGQEMIEKIKKGQVPSIVLLDINMPVMDGLETARWLKKNHPKIGTIILSMYEDEGRVLTMLRAGVKGYLLKNTKPAEFLTALDTVAKSQTYFPSFITDFLVKNLNGEPTVMSELTELEKDFIRHAATELTYKEMAESMNVSFRIIDSMRAELFERIGVKSRVGLVMYAIKKRLIEF
ncbi:response regulator transcription factor [Hufsiella ginkgonis]|uniref:Response regulator n=1 Tax=Hufsiella ginkgonis TaxID=2695274 RepID=A0A7K1XTI9_9SPHI|nr:response regulator transcription factor [Hufsiella ginkgonis]MXV14148.1 response regulator [Hufsiella ginkgonis]